MTEPTTSHSKQYFSKVNECSRCKKKQLTWLEFSRWLEGSGILSGMLLSMESAKSQDVWYAKVFVVIDDLEDFTSSSNWLASLRQGSIYWRGGGGSFPSKHSSFPKILSSCIFLKGIMNIVKVNNCDFLL